MIVIYMRKKKLRRKLKAALAREAALREAIAPYQFHWMHYRETEHEFAIEAALDAALAVKP